jgi:hypothetical protein
MRARLALAEQEHMEKLLLDDPLRAHDAIMQALTPMSAIVHKDYDAGSAEPPDDDNGQHQPMPFPDELIDSLAEVLVEVRTDFQATVDGASERLRAEFQTTVEDATAVLRERVAILEGQLSVVASLVTNTDGNRSLEASETIRKLTVR